MDEKALGNAAYKKKDFETALSHYDKAFELDGKNITFLTNKAAVHFEMGDMDKCREVCHKAVEVGRENRVDYKLIAKLVLLVPTSISILICIKLTAVFNIYISINLCFIVITTFC